MQGTAQNILDRLIVLSPVHDTIQEIDNICLSWRWLRALIWKSSAGDSV